MQVEKINIIGSSYQAELLAQIPAENLPKDFGGKCDCPGGCRLSDLGPWQEEEYMSKPKPTATTSAEAPAPAEPTAATEELKA
jgi:hypothetical protein